MNTLPFFLAQRILFSNAYTKGISIMTIICFLGIFIGSFSLSTVTAIMHGFEVAIAQKMQSIHADITIDGRGQTLNVTALSRVLNTEFPEVKSFSPHTNRHALIHTNKNTQPNVIMITAINPTTEETTTRLAHNIYSPSLAHFTSLFDGNSVIIGKQLASKNNLAIGDSFELFFTQEETIKNRKVTFDVQTVTISGLFSTGIDEFDSSVIYCSFDLLEKIFPQADIEKIALSLNSSVNEKNVIEKLHARTGLLIYSWKELYPSLIAAQKLEKYVSFFIIALILLVASMNIMSLLYMHISQKRQTIALLQSMGMTNKTLYTIFFTMSMTISIIASTAGLACSGITHYILKYFPFISLPDSYLVTHLPMALTWNIVFSVFIVVFIFSFLATLVAVRQIHTINISQVLRFE